MLSLKLLNKEKEKKRFVEETANREAYVKYTKTWKVWGRRLGRAKCGEEKGSSDGKSTDITQMLV